MHRDSPKEVEGFINFSLLYLKNISGDEIRCPYVKCKNKNFCKLDVVIMHLIKIIHREILVLTCT